MLPTVAKARKNLLQSIIIIVRLLCNISCDLIMAAGHTYKISRVYAVKNPNIEQKKRTNRAQGSPQMGKLHRMTKNDK